MRTNKKGQGFFAVPSAIIGGVLGLCVLAVVMLLTLNVLRTGGLIQAGSAEANATAVLVGNATSGVSTFATYLPTVFIVGAVVLILAILGFLLLYIYKSRMSGGGI